MMTMQAEVFKGIQGIIVPGGFGDRGVEGMIARSMPGKTISHIWDSALECRWQSSSMRATYVCSMMHTV